MSNLGASILHHLPLELTNNFGNLTREQACSFLGQCAHAHNLAEVEAATIGKYMQHRMLGNSPEGSMSNLGIHSSWRDQFEGMYSKVYYYSSNKDVHGNHRDRDIHGNRTNRDIHGNSTNRDIHGNRYK